MGRRLHFLIAAIAQGSGVAVRATAGMCRTRRLVLFGAEHLERISSGRLPRGAGARDHSGDEQQDRRAAVRQEVAATDPIEQAGEKAR